MNATPDKREGDESKTKSKTRRELYGDKATMPECDAPHILGYLIEMGVTEGDKPLTFAEIESWRRQCGIELQPWEVRFVKRLSEAYLNQSHVSRDPDIEAPWTDAPYVVPTTRQIANRMKMAIRGLA